MDNTNKTLDTLYNDFAGGAINKLFKEPLTPNQHKFFRGIFVAGAIGALTELQIDDHAKAKAVHAKLIKEAILVMINDLAAACKERKENNEKQDFLSRRN